MDISSMKEIIVEELSKLDEKQKRDLLHDLEANEEDSKDESSISLTSIIEEEFDKINEKKGKPGMWANIHAKRKRGEKPAKKGDPDRPDAKSWKDNTDEGKLTEVKIGDMVKIDKAYGGGKGKVEDKKGSFIVVNGSSYHETDVKVVYESNLTEAKLRKGDWIRSAYDELGLVNKVKGQAAYVSFDGSRSFQPMRVADLKKTKERYKGKAVFAEGKLTEAKDQKLAKLFKQSLKASVKDGEDKLYKLSQEWEDWNVDNYDKYDDLVDTLFAAIELVQDAGEPGKNNVVKDKEYYKYMKSADKLLKQFNKDVAKTMRLHKEGLNEAMDMNDPILVAIRARKTMLAKEKSAPKVKKISTKQYYKLMDAEIDLITQMKDATKEFDQMNSDMLHDAGQKGDNWSDADANKWGGGLDKLQTKVEKLAAKKRKVKSDIMNYRMS